MSCVAVPRRLGAPKRALSRAALSLGLAAAASLAWGCDDDDRDGEPAEPREAADDEAGDDEAEPRDEAAGGSAAPELPEAEPLAEGGDDHVGNVAWAIQFGGEAMDAARDVVALGDGVVVAGYVSSDVTLGDDSHETTDVDAYVTRLDAEGNHVWSRFFTGEGEHIANALAITDEGDILVAGAFAHALYIGDDVLRGAGADNIFVVKLSPDGERRWARAFGGRDVNAAHDVAAGPGGVAYVTGVFRDEVDFGADTLESEGDASIFALALSDEGDPLWARGFGASGPDYGRAIAPHPQGVVLLGEFSREVEFGDTSLESAGNRDIVLTLLDPRGEPVWARGYGAVYNEVGVDLAIDPAGDIIATGSFDEEIDFGGARHEAAGQSDAFLLKVDAQGEHLWSKRIGSSNEDMGTGVATDAYGRIAAAGWFWNEIEIGEHSLESADRRDGYAAMFSPDGEAHWAHRMGGEYADMARAVAIGDSGRVFVAGTFHRTARFGDVEFVAASERAGSEVPRGDAFVVAYDP